MFTHAKTRNRHSCPEEPNSKKKKLPRLSSLEQLNERKKIWSTETLKESMKPTTQELKFREEKLKETDILQKSSKLFRCTKCLLNFNPLIENCENVPVHPNLGVLMCKKCSDYYEDGEFSLDSDGEDKYCRWCGEGGTIFGCSKCICGFCASCIKRHFTVNFFKEVKDDDHWVCFFCDPKPLWPLRFICYLAVKKSKEALKSSKNLKRKRTERSSTPESLNNFVEGRRKKFRKQIYTSSSDESERGNVKKRLKLPDSSSQAKEKESFKKITTNVRGELKKVLKLSEYQFKFGESWCNKMLKKLESSDYLSTRESLSGECKKVKWFLSLLSTYLVQFCNSVDSVEKNLHNKEGAKVSSSSPEKNKSPYITILQFLGFVSGQIKLFMEKGINLTDVLDAKIHDDENVIGIKKKVNSPSNSLKEKNISFESHSNSTPSDTMEPESTQDQRDENEGKDKSENSWDIFDDQNSEINSPELDKELNCSDVNVGGTHHFKTTDPEEDLQEILAILENA